MKNNRIGFVALLLPLMAACVVDSRWPRIKTQKWPAPMTYTRGALEEGEVQGIIFSEPGIEEVLVLRYGDPVQVRPAGRAAAYPLAFHDKKVRLSAGSWILCSPGGKVEILWNGGSSVTMSGRTAGLVGSPTRGEPTFAFVEVENAILNLQPGDQVRLLGGASLSADRGPIAVEQLFSGVLRVENQSKGEATVLFRDATFRLDPGQELHLPLLSDGGEPFGEAGEARSFGEKGLVVEVEGLAQVKAHPDGALVTGSGDHEIRGLGLQLQLGDGEQLLMRGVQMPAAPASDAETAPVEEADSIEPSSDLGSAPGAASTEDS